MSLVCTLACAKETSKSEELVVAPLPKAEVERGRTACQTYVARVCTCAETHADMVDTCALAKMRPEAFELNVTLSTTPGLSENEGKAVKVAARKIAAACFEDEGLLDLVKCPRVGM